MTVTHNLVESLRATGLAKLEPFTLDEVVEINDHLLSRPVYFDAHIPQTGRRLGQEPVDRSTIGDSECCCVHTTEALLAPYILERALSLTDVAARYLKLEPPFLYSTNAFWTRPGPRAPRGDIQGFHCDEDDDRFLAMFTFLTDVLRSEDGAHELQGPDGVTRQVTGPAGTVFLADTSYPHRGIKPTQTERGIHWFRWCIHERPAAYVWDGLSPVASELLGNRYPTDPRLRRSLTPLLNLPSS